MELDAGHLWIHPQWATHLTTRSRHSLTADELLQATFSGELLRRRDDACGWDNVRWFPENAPGSRCVFVKRHRRSTTPSLSLQEAQNVQLCQQAQAPCMDVVAVGEIPQGTVDSAGRRFFSFFISDSIGEGLTARQAIRQLLEVRACSSEIEQIIELVAFTVARLHSASLFHGDCHLVHFLMDGAGVSRQARVIDLQGLQAAEGLTAYYLWLKDMGQLRHSLIRLGIYRHYADHWYAAYGAQVDSDQIQNWIRHSGRLQISLRGDWRLLRRIVSSAIKFDFPRARALLRDRLRAA